MNATFLTNALCCLALCVFSLSARCTSFTAAQWTTWETSFDARMAASRPILTQLDVTFAAPDGARYTVPAFWRGGRRWTVRFAPVAPGAWTYWTSCPDSGRDAGLHCRKGTLTVSANDSPNPLLRHGGFLRVSGNKRYLTYTDGTPFFWLGDTWWFCPSDLCPLEGSSAPGITSMFKALVDKRVEQGFSVAQIAFLGRGGVSRFLRGPDEWTADAMSFWQGVDEYFTYARDKGLVLAVAAGFHRGLDNTSVEDLKLLWRYIVARYGSFPVTWLIVGEYNLENDAKRVAKVIELGRYIRSIDAYRRAMTVHPWNYFFEGRQAWREDWYDFIMVQGGHNEFVPAGFYRAIYEQPERKPLLEAEAIAEGILGHPPARTRAAAYRAIQAGSFGYTYSAHGLWYPTQSANDNSFFSDWGRSPPWWEALERPGGRDMTVLRRVYEEVEWWKFEPAPGAIQADLPLADDGEVLVKARGEDVFCVYFPASSGTRPAMTLGRASPAALYRSEWIRPTIGSKEAAGTRAATAAGNLALPDAPDNDDWILIVRKE